MISLKIMLCCCLQLNKLSCFCFCKVPVASCYASSGWSSISKKDMYLSLLDVYLNNLNIWRNESMAHPFWFLTLGGWSSYLSYSTTQIDSNAETCIGYCTWYIWHPGFCMKRWQWPYLQQFLHWRIFRFILVPLIVTMKLPTLKHLLMSPFTLLPLLTFQILIHMIAISDLDKILMIWGLETNVMLLKMWFFLMISSTMLELIGVFIFFWKKKIPIILK